MYWFCYVFTDFRFESSKETASNKPRVDVFYVSIHTVSNVCFEQIKHQRTVPSPTPGHPELET